MKKHIPFLVIRGILVFAMAWMLIGRWHYAGLVALVIILVGLRYLLAHLMRRERERNKARLDPP